ncbi:nose resistant to fluoxetine protein 6, partial [Biomphalaria glabrata]
MKFFSAIFTLPVWLSKVVICEPGEKASNQMDGSREANFLSVQTSLRPLLFQAVHPRNEIEINNVNGLFRANKKDERSKTQVNHHTNTFKRNVRSSSLNSTDFGDQQGKCYSDIQRLLENMTGNAWWTLQFLDSWAKPGPSLLLRHWNMVGNYKQCRSARAPPLPGKEGTGFSGNYCILNLTPK